VLVPAMNDRMWAHTQTQDNVARCRAIGYTVIDPDTGDLAAGEGAGTGRMPEPEAIFAHVGRALEEHSLEGKHVVVTAGPTREAIDPVRFVSNRSSGRMGVAIAASAWRRGADVTLVHGPLEVALPVGPHAVPVETTAQLRDGVAQALPNADALIMAAAPADFAAAHIAGEKIKKSSAPEAIALAPTPDILAETRGLRRKGSVTVGFALETNDGVDNARAKLGAKGLDAVVLNYANEPGAGFAGDTNRVTMLFADGRREDLPLMDKTEVAEALWDRVAVMMNGR
jgi:phosphopantothenoylcysteine decarboxylase/phosphopantothenate--cysteine ligase